MTTKIFYARAKIKGEKERKIYYQHLDKEEYFSKYKGHLTCINGCKARIKFTHKKNNVKFFSTWNKEGKLHDKGCPYYVEYKGKKGREKLNAYYKSIELDDDTILRRMKRKYNELHTENGEDEYTIPNQGSMKVENRGERDVEVGINSVNGEMQKDDSYIRYKDANYVTVDDLGRILSVYGKIDNVWIGENKDGTKFAYINYITENTSVSILFSEGFYVNEDSNGTEEFERFIKKIKALVETSVETGRNYCLW